MLKSQIMKNLSLSKKILTLFLATRPSFLIASAAPVFVGSALAYATGESFDLLLFFLALFAIMALHSGANLANDYFDHISGNDQANRNPTLFSGGSRFIQESIISARGILLLSLSILALGSVLGLVIVLLTKSLFIFVLGLIGVLGGFFYTAPPVKLGYRATGEIAIAFLFGLLPVTGAYYIQTESFEPVIVLPAFIIGILIFLVILINEFPDRPADAAVNKRTLVVAFGVSLALLIYRIVLATGYVLAVLAALIYSSLFFAGLFFLGTFPIAVFAYKIANKAELSRPGNFRSSRVTVILHAIGSLAITTGLLVYAFLYSPA